MHMNTVTITTTRTKLADVPATVAGTMRIEVRTRKPESRAYTVDVPLAAWPNTTDVPSQFRPLVDAGIMAAAEQVLQAFVQSKGTAGNPQLPLDMLTLDNLTKVSAGARMTVAALLGLWRNSSKYRLEIEPKLTELVGSALLKYKALIERHEKRLAALCGRSPETTLSAADLDRILINLHADDETTQFGDWVANAVDVVRSALTEDEEAL